MRGHLADLLGPALRSGRCEAVEEVAKPYAARVIATLMGVAVEDAAQLAEWAHWIQSAFDPLKLAAARPQIEAATSGFTAHARDLVAQRRARDADDLLSRLLATEVGGDRLSAEEVVHLVTAVLIGGVDTTQSQLAHGLRLFAEHPGQWAAMVADRTLVASAVLEVLRFEPITPFTARMTTVDVVFRDVTFPAGTVVLAAAATANRDPAVYRDPDVFDVRAERRPRPLTFGAGPHVCLGASLATAELQEAFAFLAERAPRLALDGQPRYDTVTGIYGLASLPLRFPPS
jgi:cytochrome P450